MKHAARLVSLAVVLATSAGTVLGQSKAASRLTIGVLPFADATASASASASQGLSRAVQAEFLHSSKLAARVLPTDDIGADDLDVEKAIELGRKYKVDLVLIPTVLDSSSEQSTQGGFSPGFLGQSIGAQLHNVQASVTLQGDLVYLGTGALVASIRVSGRQSDRSIATTAYTSLGNYSTDDSTWQTSTLGKAVQKAIVEMVRQVSAKSASLKPVALAVPDPQSSTGAKEQPSAGGKGEPPARAKPGPPAASPSAGKPASEPPAAPAPSAPKKPFSDL
jgi:hypothetical protein